MEMAEDARMMSSCQICSHCRFTASRHLNNLSASVVVVLAALVVGFCCCSQLEEVASSCNISSTVTKAHAPKFELDIRRRSSLACAILISNGGRHE